MILPLYSAPEKPFPINGLSTGMVNDPVLWRPLIEEHLSSLVTKLGGCF